MPGMIMYQLYGALSNEDQARVFEKTPEGIRKVVYCTNIAETSLTIDNIGFVINRKSYYITLLNSWISCISYFSGPA